MEKGTSPFLRLLTDSPEKTLFTVGLVVMIVWLGSIFSYAFVSTTEMRVEMDPDQQTILVAGGAGYIGSHVVADLVENKYNVVVYDSLYKGHKQSIVGLKNVAFVKGDVRDGDLLDKTFKRFEPVAVMHFCADSLVGESVIDPLKYYDNNVGGAISLLQAMGRNGVDYIVFSSTAAIFGDPEVDIISEDTPKAPKNPYGETKLAIERMLHWASESPSSTLKYVALRYFNAAGAHPTRDIGEDHSPETHLIPNVMKAIQGSGGRLKVFGNDYQTPDGTCVRDYIHVMDLSQAHVKALAWMIHNDLSGQFNLGNGNGFSVMDVIGSAKTVTQREVPYDLAPRRAGDPPTLVANSVKAKSVLGWRPEHDSMDDIIASAWRWHQAHPAGYKD
ncbi:UDP-glucose 4-epimerase GalE [Carpediemonas membranifera]|uniref:UDP-glucose 4-epimerase n=1 Tax=Carpediemonas membranifera TaxID=201153 RepID=A0A8J6AT83_9EUKA|nr:UDP-glucose 4-epimerase GalE [Carpediemonas membranifera]|eukprot:KAG9393961.1 UDP-glucose 4-epimerase GalE [Carpediemonas membranifera]